MGVLVLKRFISLAAAVGLLLCPLSALPQTNADVFSISAGAQTSGDWEYRLLDDSTAEVTGCKSSSANISIPQTLDGIKVTKLADALFAGSSVERVTIPQGVTAIGGSAFAGCEKLKSVTLPDSVKQLGTAEHGFVFLGCKALENITLPSSLTAIEQGLFSGCEKLTIKGKAGSYAETFAKENDIRVIVVKDHLLEGTDKKISTTWLRDALSEGDADIARDLCGGRDYVYSGRCVQGKQMGRQMGFPTANIIVPEDKFVVRRGVYVSRVSLGKRTLYGVTNIGRRPTLEDAVNDVVETFIFDFDEDIYGADLEIGLMHFLRPESKMTSKEELINAVNLNKEQALEYIKNHT